MSRNRSNHSTEGMSGAPGQIRTAGQLVRSQLLYPTELRAHCFIIASPLPACYHRSNVLAEFCQPGTRSKNRHFQPGPYPKIHPGRPAGSLSRERRRRLHASIQSVLRRAIDQRGTSVDDYVDAEGLRGGFQNQLSVYSRDGQGCLRCGRSIVRTVLAQRGTWSCRTCQR